MRLARYVTIIFLAFLTGCATGNTLVQPGVNSFGAMRVTADDNWTKVAAKLTPSARKKSRTWTQDGQQNDRLMIIPSVEDGEALFVSGNESVALPVFHAGMSQNEIEELLESSIVILFDEGQSVVGTFNLRPQGFGEHGGFMFDIEAAITDGTDYRGSVGVFVVDEKLYMVLFLAAEPDYFSKHAARADAIIKSATLSTKTIRRY
jgi:hypothetical protein